MYVAHPLSSPSLPLSPTLRSIIEDDDDDFEVSAGGKTKICLKRITILFCVCLCCAPLLSSLSPLPLLQLFSTLYLSPPFSPL